MTTDTPARSFLRPRLAALVDAAVAEGIAREVAVAVLIDLVTAPPFNVVAPDPTADSEPHPDYERSPGDPLVVGGRVLDGPPVIGAQSDADFTAHPTWRE